MDDLISRQAAIDELKKISFSYWFECGVYLSEDRREIEIISSSKALEAIEALPFVQREQKTGRWIDNTVAFYRECSECGALVTNRMEKIFLHLEGKKLNYCPNCGAKMEV